MKRRLSKLFPLLAAMATGAAVSPKFHDWGIPGYPLNHRFQSALMAALICCALAGVGLLILGEELPRLWWLVFCPALGYAVPELFMAFATRVDVIDSFLIVHPAFEIVTRILAPFAGVAWGVCFMVTRPKLPPIDSARVCCTSTLQSHLA